ncbi:MAG: hypothetical protein Q9213_006133 [Squamulea squamosa]
MGAQKVNQPPDSEAGSRHRVGTASSFLIAETNSASSAMVLDRAVDAKKTINYVEALEQQCAQAINGLRKGYQILVENDVWPGGALELRPNGHPLTHDMLDSLGALRLDTPLRHDRFEEDTEKLQQKLIDDDKERFERQQSPDSDFSRVKQNPPSPEEVPSPPTPMLHEPTHMYPQAPSYVSYEGFNHGPYPGYDQGSYRGPQGWYQGSQGWHQGTQGWQYDPTLFDPMFDDELGTDDYPDSEWNKKPQYE